jgi:nicotinamide mononucleotide transporter
MEFFDINNIFFNAFGKPVSYLEFVATLFGGLAVWLSAKANIWSWPLGIINVVLSFFLFFQVQFYPDMFLQVFFFVTNVIGWWRWTHPLPGEEDRKRELKVSWMPASRWIVVILILAAGTAAFGAFAGNLHEFFPGVFSLPSTFPYMDSFTTIIAIVATYLMVEKKIECWIAWTIGNIVGTYMYFTKGIMLVGFEYFAFCLIAMYGFWGWQKEFKTYRV